MIAGWIAPAATMIAAMMTAANLGSRVTGWGFVIFLVGALAWCVVAATTGQSNLLWSNAFLGLVDIIGIWRWLGHKAKLDDGAQRAQQSSATRDAPTLFPVTMLEGTALKDGDAAVLARSVGGMAESDSGRLSYLVAREGGLGDMNGRHVAVPWSWLRCVDGSFQLKAGCDLARLDAIDPAHWPASAPRAGTGQMRTAAGSAAA
jgi:hypothetical protein